MEKRPERQELRTKSFKNPLLNAPLVAGSVMIGATQAGTIEVYSLPDKNSEEAAKFVLEWKSPSGAEIHTAPAAGSGFIVIGSDDGHIYGFSYTEK